MSISAAAPRNVYIMVDQVPGKIRSIMGESPPRRTCQAGAWDSVDERPMLSRPGWVAITLLLIAFNLMAVLPPAA